jgi:hypothetical protein
LLRPEPSGRPRSQLPERPPPAARLPFVAQIAKLMVAGRIIANTSVAAARERVEEAAPSLGAELRNELLLCGKRRCGAALMAALTAAAAAAAAGAGRSHHKAKRIKEEERANEDETKKNVPSQPLSSSSSSALAKLLLRSVIRHRRTCKGR